MRSSLQERCGGDEVGEKMAHHLREAGPRTRKPSYLSSEPLQTVVARRDFIYREFT